MSLAKTYKFWLFFSGSIVALSILALLLWGLRFGIDFTGGSLMRIRLHSVSLTQEAMKEAIAEHLEGDVSIQSLDNNEYILKFPATTETNHQLILQSLNEKAVSEGESPEAPAVEEIKFDSIGPSIGQELREKSVYAIVTVTIAIILYIAWAFRGVATEINKYESFRYGAVAVVALFHDILITLGLFAVLGHFFNVEVNTFFIAALLTILGYSVNDTIIIFDRLRENIQKKGSTNFPQTVDKSIKETLVRSLNTSLTTLLVLACILFLGGETTFYFVLALIVGIASGTYSSIFLATSILISLKKMKEKNA